MSEEHTISARYRFLPLIFLCGVMEIYKFGKFNIFPYLCIMNKEILLKLIKEGKSANKIAEELGSSQTNVLYNIRKFEIRDEYIKYCTYAKRVTNNLKKEDLLYCVKNSNSFSECLIKLKLVPRGGNFKTLRKYINLYKIDISHFTSKKIRNNNTQDFKKKKYLIDDYLVVGSNITSSSLKKKLYDLNKIDKICSLCGQDENWRGKKISLILDHINGIYNDNRLENLRIVCPNCNATLDTHCGKNKKSQVV